MKNIDNADQECCPVFDPSPWHHKVHEWNEKHFISLSIPLFLHIPIGNKMGKVIGKLNKAAEEAGAAVSPKDIMILTQDVSPWKSEILMEVTKEVPGSNNHILSGTFVSSVHDGPYREVPKLIREAFQFVKDLGKTVKRTYIYYTTCPKCAIKYGHNYMVSIMQV